MAILGLVVGGLAIAWGVFVIVARERVATWGLRPQAREDPDRLRAVVNAQFVIGGLCIVVGLVIGGMAAATMAS